MLKLSHLSQQVQPFHVMELVKKAEGITQAGHDVIHLSIGEPDFPIPSLVSSAFQEAISNTNTRYTNALGLWPLREAIAQHYWDTFQVKVDASQVVVTAGSSAALNYACLALVNPGQEVLLPDPGYPCNKTFVQIAGGVPRPIETSSAQNFQPTSQQVEALWSDNTAGLLLASPSNPTGTRIQTAALAQIAELTARKNGFLIMDEIYQSLCYGSPAHSIMQIIGAPSDKNGVVVVNSFSKYFGMTGLRLGWMVVPPHLLSSIEKLAQNLAICPSTPAQWAALACFKPNTLDECERRRLVFSERRDFLLKALPQVGLHLSSNPEGAFYLYLPSPYDSDPFCTDLLEKAHVCAVPGKDFSEVDGNKMFRISYANSMDNLVRAVERIEKFMNGLPN
ncbi:MAG: aminotransferase class I/II-fold pyridoxal phosphate-dependent enzyme [Limnobacter sp.]|nr:aminotransferase class I/II-fold pyridoxal phosphate-dependent enzyme [Limnobacter sp.]